jgi:hypothetical protein
MTLGNLIGRLDRLDIVCAKCDRRGRYGVHGLAVQHGRDHKIPDWIGDVTSTCPRANWPGLADACPARTIPRRRGSRGPG